MYDQAIEGGRRSAFTVYRAPKGKRAGYLSPAGLRALRVGIDLAIIAAAVTWAIWLFPLLVRHHG